MPTWSDGARAVQSPLQARIAGPVLAPARAGSNASSGSRLLSMLTGIDRKFDTVKGGLTDVTPGPAGPGHHTLTLAGATITARISQCNAGTSSADMAANTFAVPTGTMVLRFELREQDEATPGDDNVMIFVGTHATQAEQRATDTTNESVQLTLSAAGAHHVCVVAHNAGATNTHRVSRWVHGPDSAVAGKLNVLLPSEVLRQRRRVRTGLVGGGDRPTPSGRRGLRAAGRLANVGWDSGCSDRIKRRHAAARHARWRPREDQALAPGSTRGLIDAHGHPPGWSSMQDRSAHGNDLRRRWSRSGS